MAENRKAKAVLNRPLSKGKTEVKKILIQKKKKNGEIIKNEIGIEIE